MVLDYNTVCCMFYYVILNLKLSQIFIFPDPPAEDDGPNVWVMASDMISPSLISPTVSGLKAALRKKSRSAVLQCGAVCSAHRADLGGQMT